MAVPPEYEGREQTWLKHEFLRGYLRRWAHKRGSAGRFGNVRLWYVDCFSGPWKSRAQNREDTSVYIGLEAVKEATATWGERGAFVKPAAIFIEKDDTAYAALQETVAGYSDTIDVHTFHGEFGAHLVDIERLVGRDPAFLFVDPTGWKGAAMRFIAPIARVPNRDVLVNVMYDHINRFRYDEREFLREQMSDFFHQEVPPGLGEEELMSLYRARLGETCAIEHVADLRIPHPTRDRTYFRLVVGGHHPKVLEVFREREAQVLSRLAPKVRAEAKFREFESRTGQQSMFGAQTSGEPDFRGADEVTRARQWILDELKTRKAWAFGALWPEVLARFHVTKTETNGVLTRLRMESRIGVEELIGRRSKLNDKDVVTLLSGPYS